MSHEPALVIAILHVLFPLGQRAEANKPYNWRRQMAGRSDKSATEPVANEKASQTNRSHTEAIRLADEANTPSAKLGSEG